MAHRSSYIDATTGQLKRGSIAVVYHYVARSFRDEQGEYARLSEPRTIQISGIARFAGLPWAFAGGNIAASNRPTIKLIAHALLRLQRANLIQAYPCDGLSVCVRLRVTPETLRNRYGEHAVSRALKAVERETAHV